MTTLDVLRTTKVFRSPRVMQIEGIFDVPPTDFSEEKWHVDLDLPEKWNVGLVVGPSGSGKTTIARELWHLNMMPEFLWDPECSILDRFPDMPVKEIVELLCSVGFSSPPHWLRPFRVLSTGEQFRVNIALLLATQPHLAVVDEFTSVVDRTVAQVASAAIAKTVRRRGQQFIAVSCHYDIMEWLEPDWVYNTVHNATLRGSLWRRPTIQLTIFRSDKSAWPMFRKYHYLSRDLNPAAVCFIAMWKGRPVAFSSWLPFFGKGVHHARRGHRTVCLPDYQGVGIGTALNDWCAGYWKSHGERVFSTACHPAIIAHRKRSSLWKMTREPGLTARDSKRGYQHATTRFSASFEYIGGHNVADKGVRVQDMVGDRGEI